MQVKRYHIIYDLQNCNEKIKDKLVIQDFLRLLVKVTKMSILTGPVATEGIPENPGISAFVLIDFSHISVHTFTSTKETLIDIFSCKEFDRETAKKFCQQFFGVDDSNTRLKEVWWG